MTGYLFSEITEQNVNTCHHNTTSDIHPPMTCSGLHEKSKRNSLLKGMGDEIRIGLLHVTPKKHPLLIKRIVSLV